MRIVTKFLCRILLLSALLAGSAHAQFASQSQWLGTSTGTANAQVLPLPNVTSLSDVLGVHLTFTAGFTNTGATTVTFGSLPSTSVMLASISGLTPLVGNEFIAGNPVEVVYNGSVFVITFPGAVPQILHSNAAYYVNASTGSDSNNGLTAGTAFQTLQKAADTVGTFNLNGFNVNVTVANGTYAPVVLSPVNGSGTVIFTGNAGSPGSVAVPSSTGSALTCSNAPGRYTFNGFAFSVSATPSTDPGADVLATGTCTIVVQNIVLGTGQGFLLSAENGATIQLTGNITLSGGTTANSLANGAALNAQAAGQVLSINTSPPVFIISTSISVSSFLQSLNGFTFLLYGGVTNPGNVVGKRYNAALNGVISTGGQPSTYYPGNSSGTTSTGGQVN